MIQDLEKIEHRRGMLDKGMKPKSLPVKVWRRAKIPVDVRKEINVRQKEKGQARLFILRDSLNRVK